MQCSQLSRDVSFQEISWFQEIMQKIGFQEILPCTKELESLFSRKFSSISGNFGYCNWHLWLSNHSSVSLSCDSMHEHSCVQGQEKHTCIFWEPGLEKIERSPPPIAKFPSNYVFPAKWQNFQWICKFLKSSFCYFLLILLQQVTYVVCVYPPRLVA